MRIDGDLIPRIKQTNTQPSQSTEAVCSPQSRPPLSWQPLSSPRASLVRHPLQWQTKQRLHSQTISQQLLKRSRPHPQPYLKSMPNVLTMTECN